MQECQSLANLSRLDSLAKFSKKRAILNLSKGLFADWAKLYGPVLVFKALWKKTGLKRIISDYAKEREFEFDLSSVIFSMVLGRLLDPLSKLSTQKWLDSDLEVSKKCQSAVLCYPTPVTEEDAKSN